MRFLIVLMAGLYLLSSCALQKRRYRPGFYVSQPYSKTVMPLRSHVSPVVNAPARQARETVLTADLKQAPVLPLQSSLKEILPVYKKQVLKIAGRIAVGSNRKTAPGFYKPRSEPGTPKKIIPASATYGFLLGLLATFSVIAGAIFFMDSFFLIPVFIISLLLIALAYYYSAVALIKKSEEPDKYRTGLAVAGIVLASLCFLGFGLLIYIL